LRIPSYTWLAVLILIALPVALSFIYDADSYKTAFATGAALMVTLTLYTTFTEPGVLQFV
jgi:hypothetical protein